MPLHTLTFDHGTLLCHGLPRTALDPGAPLVWDDRVAAARAKASDHAAALAWLRSKGVEVRDRVRSPCSVESWHEITLRPYQDAACSAWWLAGRRGTIVLPTGSGKTRVGVAIIARAGVPALVLVPTRVLLHQWRDVLGGFYHGAIGAFGDGMKSLHGVTVATFESARRRMHEFGHRFELLVVDEAHHFSGEDGPHEALQMCVAPMRLGLTATPPDEPQRGTALGPVIYELSIGDLRGSFLADFELITLTTALSDREREAYDSARAEFVAAWARFADLAPSAGWGDFVRHCGRSDVGREALRGWRRARDIAGWTARKSVVLGALLSRHMASKSLVFAHSQEAAYAIAREHWVMPITAEIGRRERDRALGAFARGELAALVSARVLNEGLDVPDAEVGIVAGSAQGSREFVQRVGRVLRPGPGKRALVYELVSARTSEVRQALRRRNAVDPG